MQTGQFIPESKVGFTTGIQYVMVVNGLALLGFALWPSVKRLYHLQ
jgi:hypothetical protein